MKTPKRIKYKGQIYERLSDDNVEYVWLAHGEYADGTVIEKEFPYYEDGNYIAEADRQHDLEQWLLDIHDGCEFYSVDVQEK